MLLPAVTDLQIETQYYVWRISPQVGQACPEDPQNNTGYVIVIGCPWCNIFLLK